MIRWLLILMVLPVMALGQLQKITLTNFSGGINRWASSITDPAQAYDMVDFDLDPLGALSPRMGYSCVDVCSDSVGSGEIIGVVPFPSPTDKHLIIQRCMNSDTCAFAMLTMTGVDSLMENGLWNPGTVTGYPNSGLNFFSWGDYAYVASRNTPLMVFDGNRMFRASLQAPGAPKILNVTDSSGHDDGGASGVFRYMYTWGDDDGTGYSSFWMCGPATSWVEVRDGRVSLACTAQDGYNPTRIFREHSSNGRWQYIGALEYPDTIFIDTFPYDPTNYDTTIADLPNFDGDTAKVRPGGPTLSEGTAVAGYGLLYPDNPGTTEAWYAILWLDSLGNYGALGGPSGISGIDSNDFVIISDIMTWAPTGATKKILLRTFGYINSTECTECTKDTLTDNYGCFNYCDWFIVDTLELDATTYTDSMPACSIHIPTRQWSDSSLNWRPIDVATRNGMAAIIGHPTCRNRLGLSKAYYPGTWPPDKFIDLNSSGGDWFVKMSVEDEDALLLFRQNSIVRFEGFLYFQYRAKEIAQDIGACSPQSVVSTTAYTYFAHSSGVYRIPVGGVPEKISYAIDPLWDSLSATYTDMVGQHVDDEYWLSTGNSSQGSLVWSETLQEWRRYSFLFDAIIAFDTATADFDYRTGQYLMLRSDSLFLLNSGWIDGANTGDADSATVRPRWRSPELFAGPERERVYWVDLEGYGAFDSIMVKYYRDNGVYVDSVVSIPGWSVDSEARHHSVVRFKVDHICSAYAFEIVCFPASATGNDYRITSATVHYQPWDKGKLR